MGHSIAFILPRSRADLVLIEPEANPLTDSREKQEAALQEAMARARLKERRGKKMRPPPLQVGLAARKAVRTALKDYKGSPLSVIQDRWETIVGDKIAQVSRPVKLTGKAGARTLTLKVIPAAALLIQHQSEIVRQRVSAAAGGDITKLKLEQGQLSQKAGLAAARPAHLSAADQAQLEKDLSGIEAFELKEALRQLGTAVRAAQNR